MNMRDLKNQLMMSNILKALRQSDKECEIIEIAPFMAVKKTRKTYYSKFLYDQVKEELQDCSAITEETIHNVLIKHNVSKHAYSKIMRQIKQGLKGA